MNLLGKGVVALLDSLISCRFKAHWRALLPFRVGFKRAQKMAQLQPVGRIWSSREAASNFYQEITHTMEAPFSDSEVTLAEATM
jgi:hypothetical protein